MKTDVFTKYGPGPVPEKGAPVCVVSHPDAGGPCGRPAIGEVWCQPFCKVHVREAELAAREEISETVENEISTMIGAEKGRFDTNWHLVQTLGRADIPYLPSSVEDVEAYDEAALEAYPPEALEGNIDADTLRFDYDREDACDGPFDWWSDAQNLLCRFMRQAADKGLSGLLDDLEPLRERATVQMILAERDLERRYAAPRRAAKEAAKQA